nr:Lrp/AsnC ligand binding domain-containing protein [Bradyrhizobium sp. 1]
MSRIPEVMEAYLVTGDYDYLIKVVVRDTDHYERFLRQALYRIPGIRQSRTTFGLRTLKRKNFDRSFQGRSAVISLSLS